jgi:hypothetical protein
MVWVYDDIGDSYQQTQYRSLIKLTKNEKIARDGSRMLGLFNYLKTKKFEDSKHLRNSVFFDKKKTKHFFTEDNAKKTFDFLTKKHGGSDGALDHLINRWFNFVYSMIPIDIRESFVDPPINFISVFTLNNLEQIPVFGRSLAFSVDVALAINKNVAKMLQQYMPIAVGSTPIPFGAVIGTVIGYVMSTFFIFINEMIYVSRNNFGEAWTQSLAFLPLIGTALQNWAESGDKLLEKFADKRKDIIDDLYKSPMFSWMGEIIEDYTFDLTSDGAPSTENRFLIEDYKPDEVPSAGKRLSTKKNKKGKWKTRRQRSAKF